MECDTFSFRCFDTVGRQQEGYMACKMDVNLLLMTTSLKLCTSYSSSCHHSPPPPPLAPIKSRMETFWYWLNQDVLENCCLDIDDQWCKQDQILKTKTTGSKQRHLADFTLSKWTPLLISTVVMFEAQNRKTIIGSWKVAVSLKINVTTSVIRPCFTTQHQTCKTKTKIEFFGLRPVLSQ